MTRTLDGSSAGGQYLRTALALSVLENEPVRIENVRGDRPSPGLGHQHLAVLEAMVDICDADATGAELGAETVEFDPDFEAVDGQAKRERLPGGRFAVDIGTAGSATLLVDALMPLSTILESTLTVTVTGGTDVAWSPPLDYVRHVKLPLLRRFGLAAALEVDRRGFYPAGGGRTTLSLAPSTLERIDLVDRGSPESIRLYSTESASLADRDVAFRQAEGALERLTYDHPLELEERCETTAASACPGSSLVVRVDHGTGVGGFTSLGERGKPAERVGEDAADAANRFLAGTAPVDRHMADQLLVFLALAGGRVRVPAVTDHVETGCALLEEFGVRVDLQRKNETAIVSVSAPLSGDE
ncbi:RNA 3'-terminal phosphate cyclase [Natrinema halophilum]|uniref:RNA 3'-terminal phosphate cyclase n=1 Tax=Natrinema halophilum TaxID=1699371 RepID=A0A7D5GKZ1_9EURY|nr:RNA 3'-terminal phosphate cyclase [Natrinema halophilum]QLG49072.1 RNA 3'-terminal phosphate cyclase [Natrinema halophilum]